VVDQNFLKILSYADVVIVKETKAFNYSFSRKSLTNRNRKRQKKKF